MPLALRLLGLVVGGLGVVHAINVAFLGGAVTGAFGAGEGIGRWVAVVEPLAVALFRGGVLVGLGEALDRLGVRGRP